MYVPTYLLTYIIILFLTIMVVTDNQMQTQKMYADKMNAAEI